MDVLRDDLLVAVKTLGRLRWWGRMLAGKQVRTLIVPLQGQMLIDVLLLSG